MPIVIVTCFWHYLQQLDLMDYVPEFHENNRNENMVPRAPADYTANISTVLSTAFGSVTCATVIWLYIL